MSRPSLCHCSEPQTDHLFSLAIVRPVVELNFMGYAKGDQVGSGLRQRLYCRAFIVGDVGKESDCFVYLVLDTQSGDTAVRHGILEGLRNLGPAYAVYNQQNVALTGTHSHSGPGAWLNYLLPQISSKGFDKQSYQAIVDGALLSIQRAHKSRARGRLSFGTTVLKDASINRSGFAYLANPEEERKRYEYDVDKTLSLLRFQREADGRDIGVLTWFAVHGTSLHSNNTLVTGDNKGVAARLFEQEMVTDERNGSADFVAGFSQSNVGDTTPNIMGAYCEDGSNLACKFEDSTCGGRNEDCHGRGPHFGLDDGGTKSCHEIGQRQYLAASDLLRRMRNDKGGGATAGTPLQGSTVRSFHTFINLSTYSFALANGSTVSTCSAALGYGFAGGTSDGPGEFDFTQGVTYSTTAGTQASTPKTKNASTNPLWQAIRHLIHEPTEEQKRCQYPKPVLLDVGPLEKPYAWAPNIVDIQLLRVGQLVIIVSPGEATTMAGRRWRDAVAAEADRSAVLDVRGDGSRARRRSPPAPPAIVVLGGPANTYTHYITTEQEYAVQRYEGASTLYGPHTLSAYIDLSLKFLPRLSQSHSRENDSIPDGVDATPPPINTDHSLSYIIGVVFDSPGPFGHFGEVITDVGKTYSRGETVKAVFVGANPRNNLRLEKTYAAVERRVGPPTAAKGSTQHRRRGQGDDQWLKVRDDADYDLVFRWRRTNDILATSEATVEWEVGNAGLSVEDGVYRLRYWGDAKDLMGKITPFEGISGEFSIGGEVLIGEVLIGDELLIRR